MTAVRVFDPRCAAPPESAALIDPQLVRFAADLNWSGQGGRERFNLSQQPGAFAKRRRESALEQRASGLAA